jgi:hypothetical protein
MKSFSLLLTRSAFFFIIFILLVSIVNGQTPDFSGKWNISASKSKLNEQFSMAPKSLILTQSDKVLTVERHGVFQDQEYTTTSKLNLDGSESVNDGMMGAKITSVATWSDDKSTLTVKTKIPMEGGGEFNITEIYKMSGPDLSVGTSSISDFGNSQETYVFEKEK